jgi:hypothetical protein
MKIAILGSSHKSFISPLLSPIGIDDLPDGYNGAPFIGILIKELLSLGHKIVVITKFKHQKETLVDKYWCEIKINQTKHI